MLRLFTCLWLAVLPAFSPIFSQNKVNPDTLRDRTLREISVHAQRETMERLPAADGTYLWSGKKSEVVQLQNLDANVAEKTPRQIFAKIPGVFVYDMDGAGNQTNISTRGLDPHRGWEFNIRADGMVVNSDMYGYPASHFSLPFEAVGRIELVRGTGALQYGAQFGGMLNYVLRTPDTTRRFGAEIVSSAGSNGLFSAFGMVGGRVGKLQYMAFYSQRRSDGWRANADSRYDGEGFSLKFFASKNLALRAELLRSRYRYHIPGPLTDAQFAADPRQSTRTRNWFEPEIWVPSLAADWKIGPKTTLRASVSGLFGERRSVQFDRPATVADLPDPATAGLFAGRQVDVDGFHSLTAELRLLHEYRFFGKKSTLAAGVQGMDNDLHRQQQGKGTAGSDFDLSISTAGWGRDLHFRTKNMAFFAENRLDLTPKLSVSPGLRIESGASEMTGSIAYLPAPEVPNTIRHRFPLFGANAEFRPNAQQTLYAGWSQAYRPVIFKDIIPANFYERADKNLRDAEGYNLELGWRGRAGRFDWDLSAFQLRYNHRVGSLAQFSPTLDTVILWRTNIGDSRTNGLEIFGEYRFPLGGGGRVSASIFTSTAYFDAQYLGDSVRVSASENRSIAGKRVEAVPTWISRNGLTIKAKRLSTTLLYSYTGSSFADALNTEQPSATGAVGRVPAYGLWDLNLAFRSRHLTFRVGVNNLTDVRYFTKRPTFYPGPGVWPSEGRGFVVSVAARV